MRHHDSDYHNYYTVFKLIDDFISDLIDGKCPLQMEGMYMQNLCNPIVCLCKKITLKILFSCRNLTRKQRSVIGRAVLFELVQAIQMAKIGFFKVHIDREQSHLITDQQTLSIDFHCSIYFIKSELPLKKVHDGSK